MENVCLKATLALNFYKHRTRGYINKLTFHSFFVNVNLLVYMKCHNLSFK